MWYAGRHTGTAWRWPPMVPLRLSDLIFKSRCVGIFRGRAYRSGFSCNSSPSTITVPTCDSGAQGRATWSPEISVMAEDCWHVFWCRRVDKLDKSTSTPQEAHITAAHSSSAKESHSRDETFRFWKPWQHKIRGHGTKHYLRLATISWCQSASQNTDPKGTLRPNIASRTNNSGFTASLFTKVSWPVEYHVLGQVLPFCKKCSIPSRRGKRFQGPLTSGHIDKVPLHYATIHLWKFGTCMTWSRPVVER